MFNAHREAKTFAESFMRLENKDLRKRLAALQDENWEKDKEIERLKSELLEAREDHMASEAEREQGLAALSRVEAERDAAVTFIQHIDREYGHYIADTGFERWRGAQGEG